MHRNPILDIKMSKKLEIVKTSTALNLEFNRCCIDDAVKQFRNELTSIMKAVMSASADKDVQFMVDSVDGHAKLISYVVETDAEMKARLKEDRERKQYERLKAKFEPNLVTPSDLTSIESDSPTGLFKSDKNKVAWRKTGDFQITTAMPIEVVTPAGKVSIKEGAYVNMPYVNSMIGEDYTIWYNHSARTLMAYPVNTLVHDSYLKLGGFHYAPGGNADDRRVGGDDTPSINEYSFWDLNFRPDGNDPRGMTLVNDSFWVDIYLLNIDHIENGTSKYNTRIADGKYDESGCPVIPSQNGGDGKSRYDGLNYYQALEILESHGKRMVTESEFAQLAYGTTENISGNTDPVDTILRKEFTSKWGVMLSTGNMWIWGQDAALFGAGWNNGSGSGSRASSWGDSATNSHVSFGARGAYDHLILG